MNCVRMNTFRRTRKTGAATLSKASIGFAKSARAASILPWICGYMKILAPFCAMLMPALRCGIGVRSRHPYLNVALPGQFETRERRQIDPETLVFRPIAFYSRMPIRTPFFHETDFSVTDLHVIYGPYSRLPLGKLRAEFAFELSAPPLSLRRIEIAVEAVRDSASDVIAFKRKRLVFKPLG